ncbi:hypothetical protein H2198_000753 [Neophaeococcomyces mojaviensis]|uniref:Uncharacterized protein n=1 Tax=Neophaeococcomyces mojaviensis TaxID=3383035 RepID=A0ACC3AIT4_9EURO|nr:hypothetical protein H2198_000753 [Knufia sp. JES_112]
MAHDPDEKYDPDYEEDSEEEPDDDIKTQFVGRAKAAEQPLARKYGWKTAGTIDPGKENERTLFFESPGHHAVAHMHDLGKPEESSLANANNIVTSIETNNLYKGLEPWEFEAVEQCSGKTRSELLQLFPEACHLQLSDLESVRVQPLQGFYCCNCNRPVSLETMERLFQHIMEICEECGMVQRPANPVDDPDWWEVNPGIEGAMESCHCRCRCSVVDVIMASPTEDIERTFAEVVLQELERERQAAEIREHAAEQENEQYFQQQEEPLLQLESAWPSPMQVEMTVRGYIRDSNEEYFPLEELETRDRIRQQVDLPELRFSDLRDWFPRVEENVRFALEDAQVAHSMGEPLEARQYVNVARNMAYEGGLAFDHELIVEAERHLEELEEIIDARNNEQADNVWERDA